MMFVGAVNRTPEINGALRAGLQALGPNSLKVRPANTRKCEGSVDMDGHLSSKYPSASRWDYAVGYDQKTFFIEIHPATIGDIQQVVNKSLWLRGWLKTKAPALHREGGSFHWIPSGRNGILRDSPQALNMARQHGITLEKNVMALG